MACLGARKLVTIGSAVPGGRWSAATCGLIRDRGAATEVGKRARGRSEDCTEWRRDQGTPLGTLGRISERVGRILERLGRILAHLERILERLGRILGRIWGCQRDRKASIIEH